MKKLAYVPVIVGPTACGKTDLALFLAEKLNAAIISADSRQIYTYMDIGTAKPTAKELSRVQHFFIDHAEPDQNYSAGDFSREARAAVINNLNGGRNCIVAGGSGMYIKALLDGIIEADLKDESVREQLNSELREKGLPALYAQLKKIDPPLAGRISENDRQRILRGLEAYFVSGKPLSEWHKESTEKAPFDFYMIGLTMHRQELYKRINNRVDRMIAGGLIREVRELLQKGYRHTNALNAVGYKEVVSYLDGTINEKEMAELIKRNSRRYAKRQLTWFNADPRIHWFDVGNFETANDMHAAILAKLP